MIWFLTHFPYFNFYSFFFSLKHWCVGLCHFSSFKNTLYNTHFQNKREWFLKKMNNLLKKSILFSGGCNDYKRNFRKVSDTFTLGISYEDSWFYYLKHLRWLNVDQFNGRNLAMEKGAKKLTKSYDCSEIISFNIEMIMFREKKHRK